MPQGIVTRRGRTSGRSKTSHASGASRSTRRAGSGDRVGPGPLRRGALRGSRRGCRSTSSAEICAFAGLPLGAENAGLRGERRRVQISRTSSGSRNHPRVGVRDWRNACEMSGMFDAFESVAVDLLLQVLGYDNASGRGVRPRRRGRAPATLRYRALDHCLERHRHGPAALTALASPTPAASLNAACGAGPPARAASSRARCPGR